jgi:hypothetical protein
MSWYSTTLSDDADLTARYTSLASLAADSNWTEKHPIAKREIGRMLRNLLNPIVDVFDLVVGSNGSYTAGSSVFTSSGAGFNAAPNLVLVGNLLNVISEVKDVGNYIISVVTDGANITIKTLLDEAFIWTETQSGVSFKVRPDVLDLILSPESVLKETAVSLAAYYVWGDLLQGTLDSDAYAAQKAAALKDFEANFENAKDEIEILNQEIVTTPLQRRPGNVSLLRA